MVFRVKALLLLLVVLPCPTLSLAQAALFARPAAARRNRSVLFVLHDAGETFALSAAIHKLVAGNVRVKVLPLGQPADDVARCRGQPAGCKPLPATTLRELGVHFHIVDGTAGRGQLLPTTAMQVLRRALRPNLVVTGMNYAMQLQIGRALRSACGASFVAYFDSLRLLGSDSDIPATLQRSFATHCDEVWIPSRTLWPTSSAWGSKYRVVGQPTLQEWRRLREQVGILRAARERLFGKEAAAMGSPAAIWFGGYGPGYEEALRSWCMAAKSLNASGAIPGLRFALSSHPGNSYKLFDRSVLRDQGVEDLVVVVPSDIPGNVAALACNLTASQGSTGGVQSIFAGKPALFLDPVRAFRNSDSLGVRIGLIPSLHSASEAVEAVRAVARAGWSVDTEKLASAGVPPHANQQVVGAVRRLLVPALAG